MTKQTDRDRRAREYVDKVVAINRRHGMGGKLPKDLYEDSVRATARVFEKLP